MKEVKVAFREQANSVVAEVSVKYTDNEVDNDKALAETSELMNKALQKCEVFKMRKNVNKR